MGVGDADDFDVKKFGAGRWWWWCFGGVVVGGCRCGLSHVNVSVVLCMCTLINRAVKNRSAHTKKAPKEMTPK